VLYGVVHGDIHKKEIITDFDNDVNSMMMNGDE